MFERKMKRNTLSDLYRETENWILIGAAILAVFLFLRLAYSGAERFFVLGLSVLAAILFFMLVNLKYGKLPSAEHAGINRRSKTTLRDKKLLFFAYVLMVVGVGIKTDVEELLEIGAGNAPAGNMTITNYVEFCIVGIINFICVGALVRGYASSRFLFEREIYWIRGVYTVFCLLALLGLSFIAVTSLSAESVNGNLGHVVFSLAACFLALYCLVRFLLNLPRK